MIAWRRRVARAEPRLVKNPLKKAIPQNCELICAAKKAEQESVFVGELEAKALFIANAREASRRLVVKMKERTKKYWFPAKRYGWGWGFPQTWQGWLVLGLFILICSFSSTLGQGTLSGTVGVIIAASACLLAVAYWKGEPPAWRWGRESSDK